MGKENPEVAQELEARVEALGLEVVELEWGGASSRPILRLRVDLPDSRPGHGVTVDDCARVSRELEAWLDEHPALPEKYVLEVSSPGVERPLVRHRDWVRFSGSRVRVKGVKSLGPSGPRVEGRIVGVEGGADDFRVRLELDDGEVLELAGGAVAAANLVFDWDQ